MPPNDAIARARSSSENCPFCEGDGMVTIFHRDYTGQPYVTAVDRDGRRRMKLLRCAAYCACELGQAISENHQDSAKDVYKRTPNLKVIFGKDDSLWSPDDPTVDLDAPDVTWASLKAEMNRKPVVATRPGPPTRKSIFGDGPRARPPEPVVAVDEDDDLCPF